MATVEWEIDVTDLLGLQCTAGERRLPPSPFGASGELATLVDIARWRAESQPDDPAFTFLADGEREEGYLTYAALDRRARAIAGQLQLHTTHGDRVLVAINPGLDYVAAMFGCMYAGLIAVPVYPPDPLRVHRTLPRLEAILRDAEATFVLASEQVLQWLEGPLGQASGVKMLAVESIAGDAPLDYWPFMPDKDQLAVLQYTSGSTGSPRGVMLTHGNLMHTFAALDRLDCEVGVCWLPPYHDMGLIGGILWRVYSGGHTVLMSPMSFIERPVRWLSAISRYRATTSGGPNFGYELCVRRVRPEDCKDLDLSTWRVTVTGAEPIRPETIDRFVEKFGPFGFRRETFYPAFGLAEATVIVSGGQQDSLPTVRAFSAEALKANRAEASGRHDPTARRLIGCGPAVPETEIVIADPRTRRRVKPTQVGEIWVRGPVVGEGYWNRAEETEEVFRAHLAGENGQTYLRTGDLGFLHRGELFVTGRLKELIILGGRNFYPHDIEQTVSRAHPTLKVDGGAAFSVEADGEEELVVVQEARRSKKHNVDDVLAAIRQAVAEEHGVVPRAVVLIAGGTLPKTSSGKTQRRACREMFLEGRLQVLAEWRADAADGSGDDRHTPSDPPRTPIEKALARIFSEVLGVEPIARDDDFFALGGQSLLAVQLMSRITTKLHVSLPMERLFERPTVAGLAECIADSRADGKGAESSAPRPTIPRRSPDEPAVLSLAEERLWFFDQLEPQHPFYNLPVAASVVGPLDEAAFEESLQQLARRHETLRTVFPIHQGRPLRKVVQDAEVPIRRVDLRSIAEDQREEELQRLLREEARRPFNLAAGPLFRCVLYRLGEEEHVVLLAMHHIVCDGWSVGVILREWAVLYRAVQRGWKSPLPPLEIDYADFAAWQQRHVAGEVLDEELSYWKQRLGDLPPALELPTDRPRPTRRSFEGACRPIEMSDALCRRLGEFARREGTTPFVVLLAAYKAILHRYCRQDDITVGTVVANRTRPELENLVGFFANTLALRTDVSGDPTFRELIDRVSEVALGAFSHQELPFAKLVEALAPERHQNQSPLFQAAMILENMPLKLSSASGLTVESIPIDNGTSKYDLTLIFSEQDGRLVGRLEYATALFDAATIDRMIASYLAALEAALADQDLRISELPVPAERERRQLLEAWNDTRLELPDVDCLHQLIEAQVERTPDAVAITYEGRSLTYREIDSRANQLAHYLQTLGVGPDVLVGLHHQRLPEVVVAMLAVLKAGGAYVPLDPSLPPERLALMIENASPGVLLTRAAVRDGLPPTDTKVVCLETVRDQIDRMPTDPPECRATKENLAYVIYTSGSTGVPKGVMIPHGGVINCVTSFARRPGLRADDVLLATTTISFDIAVLELLLPLAVGARIALATRETATNGERLAAMIHKEKATVFQATPTSYRMLLATGWRPEGELRLWCGGEAMTVDLAEQLLDGAAELWNVYGPTETTIWSTIARVTEPEQARSIGRPIANTQIYVLDANNRPAPVGVMGELYIGGLGLARGYYQRPDLTESRFTTNPFGSRPGERMYRTGDIARWRGDGTLEFFGRSDDQVKIRGHRIEPGEIVTVLREHPGVRQAAVVPREAGCGEKRLVAYLVLAEQSATDPESLIAELRSHLKAKLPEYMVPAAFMVLDDLPRTPQGKLDRRALPAPQSDRAERSSECVAPRDGEEALVASVWEELLKVSPVGVTDDFFSLGGHSLLAVQVTAEIERRTGRRLPIAALFQEPTVEHLARLLRMPEKCPPEESLVPLSRQGNKRPFFCVHPAGGTVFCYRPLAERLGTDRPFYALQAVGVDGLRPPHEQAEEMAAHYIEAIRTVQPRGPYLLGGWSLGGILAFEMARQLSKEGEKVELLALFDSGAMPADRTADYEDFLRMVGDFFPHEENLPLEDLQAMTPEEQLDYFVHRAAQIGLVAADGQQEAARNVFEVFKSCMKVLLEYRPQPYSGKITLFRAERDTSAFDARDPQLGWRPFAAEGVEVHHVPGDHAHMVDEPNVSVLAERLREALERTESGP